MHDDEDDEDGQAAFFARYAPPEPLAEQLTPYEGLTPHAVLDALDAVGLRGDGRILQLNSYENRVFQVGLDDSRFVVAKFYREGRWSDAQILEEHAFALELAADDIPVVAPLTLHEASGAAGNPPGASAESVRLCGQPATLAHVGPWRVGVTPRCAGRDPELEDPTALQWVGRFIARMHTVGQRASFQHRLVMQRSLRARQAVDWLTREDILPPQAAEAWARAARAALDQADRAFDAADGVALLRIHGDMHRGNLLWRPAAESEPGGPHFVDLDDTCTGPAVQDLWMLLSGGADSAPQMRHLLNGYETIRSFDRRELRLIEPLRTLRVIQHSAWIAKRWRDPAFPVAFPGFDSPSWWSQQATQLVEQMEAMARPPLPV